MRYCCVETECHTKQEPQLPLPRHAKEEQQSPPPCYADAVLLPAITLKAHIPHYLGVNLGGRSIGSLSSRSAMTMQKFMDKERRRRERCNASRWEEFADSDVL